MVLEFVLRLAVLFVLLVLVVWDIRRERRRGVDPPGLPGLPPDVVTTPNSLRRPQEKGAGAV
jgi:hypothetical protein